MALETKQYLNNNKFQQTSGDTLTLNGNTTINGSLNINKGNDTEIIFNNSGTLSGNTAFTFSGTTQSFTHGGRYSGCVVGQNSAVLAGGTYTVASGDGSFAAIQQAYAVGCQSIAMGRFTNATGCRSVAIGGAGAYGDRSIALGAGISSGFESFSVGALTVAAGGNSIAIGGTNVRACGCRSTVVGGIFQRAYANCSSIFGGSGNYIQTGNTRAAIIGGYSINLTGNTYIDTTAVSKLAIIDSPSVGTSGDTILVRDSSTGIIRQINQSGLTSGGGSSVAGNNTEIQFNDNGTFGASSGFTFSGDTLDISGKIAFSGNTVLRVTNNNGIVVGGGASINCGCGTDSVLVGRSSCACGTNSISVGSNNLMRGTDSIGIGRSVSLLSNDGIGIGRSSIGGACGVSMGYSSNSSNNAVAIGNNPSANGLCSISVGSQSIANCDDSISIGANSLVCTKYSIALGKSASAIGANTVVIGQNNIANCLFSGVIGGSNNTLSVSNAILLGGLGNTITSVDYDNHTIVQNLTIYESPVSGNSSTSVLVRDASTGVIQERAQADVASASDSRLKNLLQPISGVLDGISTLNTYEYEFNDLIKPESLKGKIRYGLIAQELESVFPHVVEDDYSIGDETYKSVRYNEIIPILVKAIQELKEEIDILKNK